MAIVPAPTHGEWVCLSGVIPICVMWGNRERADVYRSTIILGGVIRIKVILPRKQREKHDGMLYLSIIILDAGQDGSPDLISTRGFGDPTVHQTLGGC